MKIYFPKSSDFETFPKSRRGFEPLVSTSWKVYKLFSFEKLLMDDNFVKSIVKAWYRTCKCVKMNPDIKKLIGKLIWSIRKDPHPAVEYLTRHTAWNVLTSDKVWFITVLMLGPVIGQSIYFSNQSSHSINVKLNSEITSLSKNQVLECTCVDDKLFAPVWYKNIVSCFVP